MQWFKSLREPRAAFAFGVFLLAIGVRWIHISRLGLTTDGVYSVFYAQHLDQVWADSHSPFFYSITRLFGSLLGWSELSARLYPLVLSTFLLLFLYRRLLKSPSGRDRSCYRWLFLLVAVSPLDWLLAREARMYGPMFVFSLLEILFAIEFLEAATFRNFFVLSLVATLNCFNQVAAAVFSASILSYFMIRSFIEDGPKWYAWAGVFIASVIPSSLYYFLTPGKVATARAQIAWVRPPSIRWVLDLFQSFTGVRYPYVQAQSPLFEGLLVAAVGAFFLVVLGVYVFRINKKPVKSRIRNLFASPAGLFFFSFLMQNLICLIIASRVRLFNENYFVSLDSAFLVFTAWTLTVAFQNKAAWQAAFVVAAVAFNVGPRGLLRFREGPRENFAGFLRMKFDGMKMDCDYRKLVLGDQLLYSFDPGKLAYCSNLAAYLQDLPALPDRILLYATNEQISDKKRVQEFLDRFYVLKERRRLPPEYTILEFYERAPAHR